MARYSKRKTGMRFSKAVQIFLLLGIIIATAVATRNFKQNSGSVSSSEDFLPAFPGAEGFGAQSIGGRGGRVIFVTNTNNSGSGSFRAAVEASGPRIVVFKTGGTITLSDHIHVRNPYITIAAQTAPGDGIVLKGGGLFIGTHDVVVRGLRVRVGDSRSGPSATSRDGVNATSSYTGQDIYNVVVDHSSISWGLDENMSTWTDKVRDVTFQYNISSEALDCSIHLDEIKNEIDCHSMGMLLGGKNSKNISVHHNLFAHNSARNPRTVTDTTEIVNNVMYNWNSEALMIVSEGTVVNISAVKNYFKPGPDTRTQAPRNRGIRVSDSLRTGSKVYVNGNIGPNRLTDSGDNWNAVFCERNCFASSTQPFTTAVTNIESANDAYNTVLTYAGATSPRRDRIDERVVGHVRNRGGRIIDSQSEVGGWLAMPAGSYPADSDNDGIPNSWETSHNLNPSSASDATQNAPSGYMWIEEYVNSLIQMPPFVAASTPTQAASGNTFVRKVWKSEDDAEQLTSNGTMTLNSPDLDMVRNQEGTLLVGLRFGEVEISPRAQITNAYIELTASSQSSTGTSLQLYGQASDNPGSFTSTRWNLSEGSRSRTSASVSWNNISSLSSGQTVRTPNLSSIVQQIVNRGGWRSGNSMVFIIRGNGQRIFESWDGSANNAPKLVITYR